MVRKSVLKGAGVRCEKSVMRASARSIKTWIGNSARSLLKLRAHLPGKAPGRSTMGRRQLGRAIAALGTGRLDRCSTVSRSFNVWRPSKHW